MFKVAVLVGGFASIMGVALAVMPAQAAPVTSWSFTVNAGFSSYTSDVGGHTGITASDTNTYLGDPSQLSWGTSTGSGQSSLNLGGTNGLYSGSLTTGASPVNTVAVTANNRPITGDTLAAAIIADSLQLTPTSPPGSQFGLPQLSFNIAYDETDNSGTCAAPSTTPCADILAITNLTNAGFNTSNPSNIYISQVLPYNGEDYDINLFLTGLVELTSAECTSVNNADGTSLPTTGSNPGCVGFISQESNSNVFQASLQILDAGPVGVPEPATVALFGAGLLGLGGVAARRRRKTNAA